MVKHVSANSDSKDEPNNMDIIKNKVNGVLVIEFNRPEILCDGGQAESML